MWMRCRETQAFLEVAVREILERDPDAGVKAIQDALGVSLRTAYRFFEEGAGMIAKVAREGQTCLCQKALMRL